MIETSRLILRPWTEADLPEFIRISNTATVMEHLGGVAANEKFHAAFERSKASQREHGFCLWLMERRSDHALLGLCGLKMGTAGPIDGEIEIGWRIGEDFWGQGYALEAATASLDWAWTGLASTDVRHIGQQQKLGPNGAAGHAATPRSGLRPPHLCRGSSATAAHYYEILRPRR